MASVHGAFRTGGEQVTGERYCPAPWHHWKNRLRQVAQAVCRAVSERVRPEPKEQRAAVNQRAETLLKAHGPGILRFAYSYLHNMADAEEILQDTLIQYLKTAPVLETEAHEKAWLYRVAGNLSKNRIAYNRVRSADELNESLIADQREDLSFVWEAVKALPVRYREVIHLFYYEGLPTGHIAAILKVKESTVRSRLLRGREKLRAVLKEGYDFGEGLYGGGLAEIAYSGEEQNLVFRKAMGQTDPSGDYTAYAVQTTVDVDGSTVTLNGAEDGYCLAVWQDGTYSWSIRSTMAYSTDVWTEILESVA